MMTALLLYPVGCVFLFTGIIKVIYSRPFILHVRHLKILPPALNEIAASLFIQLECAIGVALILSVFPIDLVPVLMALILVLSIVTAWGVRNGRVNDCGCYGGWLSLDLKQSLGLNALYLVMLGVAWVNLDGNPPFVMWKVAVIIVVLALSNFLVRGSANAPLIDISSLKPGRPWKSGWLDLDEFVRDDSDSVFLIFMSPGCYLCKDWDPYIINLMETPELPRPVLIFPETDGGVEERLKGIPHRTIKPGTFRYLVYQTPTGVLVTNGRIVDRWVIHFPEAFV